MSVTKICSGVIALMALAAVSAAHAAAPPPPRDVHDHAQVERFIRACEAEWAAQDATNDTASSKVCLADDYQGVSSHAHVVNKAQAMQADPGPITVVSDTVDYIHIRFPTPDVAIAQGGETAVNKDGSRRSLIWTDTWLLRAGQWQIVTSQDSVLAKPYERAKP
ncbi:nuclear transport factor 2 family protein [Phenylobacterium sp.]|jgi:hypothetical protein|uniref:nuclear transport factor 2 family protein n=1 Tax=Phenylobacterium sp. TaxID=1871053 RepID=UPI002E35C2B1|nr:nuclear transport factor 2 family protein [Phenylobacterium sp.]HEX3366693.1 nuclear transport factor 2 family protein [Phenylobacterium sp.]